MVETRGRDGNWSKMELDEWGFSPQTESFEIGGELYAKYLRERRKNEELQHLVNRIMSGAMKHHIHRQMSDREAKDWIIAILLNRKRLGIKTVNILDIMEETNLPAEQISKVMEIFEKEKKIKEI